MIALLCASAFAEHLAHVESVSTEILDVVLSQNEQTVALLDSGSNAILEFSLLDWSTTSWSPCSNIGGVVYVDNVLYAGCGDGVIASQSTTNSESELSLESGNILSLDSLNGVIYALAENPTGGNPRVHAIEMSSGIEKEGGYPSTLGYSGFEDAAIVGNYLIVTQSGSAVSKIDLSSGSAARNGTGPTAVKLSDILPETDASNALIAAGTGGLIRFLLNTNETQYALGNAYFNEAVAVATDGQTVWVHDTGDSVFRAFEYSGSGLVGTTELDTVSATGVGPVMEMVRVNGYLIAATLSGDIVVVTDSPWVDAGSASPSMNGQGDEFSFSFTSDTTGDYSIRVGATTNDNGTVVETGSVVSDEAKTISLIVDEKYEEGDNTVRIVVDDGQFEGYDSVTVGVDNPPGTVTLSESSIGFGSEKLTVDFNGIQDIDVSKYIIYVSEEEFDSDTYETGGPSFSGMSEKERTISAIPNEDYRVTLYPLENGVRYYIGIRAYDEGGLESVMSNIVSGIPKETLSASELSNESGGFCGTNLPLGWATLTLGAIALVGRRRQVFGLALLLGVGSMSTSVEASALFTSEDEKVLRSSYEMRYGPINFESNAINSVFTVTSNQMLYSDIGWSAWNIIEVQGGAGFFQEMGWLLSEDGQTSSEHDMLTIVPFSLSGTARLDILKEQFLVPFGSYGLDYWVFKENWATSSGEQKVTGGKKGSHVAFGAQILLDKMDPGSASKLSVRTGITDTFLSIERRILTFEDTGLDFSSDSTTVGLRFHY